MIRAFVLSLFCLLATMPAGAQGFDFDKLSQQGGERSGGGMHMDKAKNSVGAAKEDAPQRNQELWDNWQRKDRRFQQSCDTDCASLATRCTAFCKANKGRWGQESDCSSSCYASDSECRMGNYVNAQISYCQATCAFVEDSDDRISCTHRCVKNMDCRR